MLEQSKRNDYRNFCDKVGLPVFVHDWHLDAVCKDGLWDAVLIKEKDEVVGALPYFIKTKLGFSYITMPIGIKHMGPFLVDRKNNIADQHLIYEQLIQELPKVDRFNQSFHPSVQNWLAFHWNNYLQTTKYTYQLDISNTETVYHNLSDKTKYKIRKAKKKVQIIDSLDANQFHDIHQMSFDRQGLSTPLSREDFLKYDALLEEHQARKMFFAIDPDQNIHAALYIILDKEIAYMHFLGSNPNFQKSEAVNYLYWHTFQHLNQHHGIRLIDYQGGMMKNIENIFRRFRAHQIPYFIIYKKSSTLFNLIQRLRGKGDF